MRLDRLILNCQEVDEINELNDDTDLLSDCDYDSLSLIQLLVKIEDEFGIKVPDEQLDIQYLRKYIWWKDLVLRSENKDEK